MKIRTALTLRYILATASVLLVMFVVIYLVSERARSQAFYADLRSEAVTKAHLFLQNRVSPTTMQEIYTNNRQFIHEVEVAVYTPDFDMLYHDAIDIDIIKEDRQMIDHIVADREIEFTIGEYQGVGLLYELDGTPYVVTAAAFDGAGRAYLQRLRFALVGLFFVGLCLLYVAGYVMARSALRPIRQITREAETITATDIDRRLPVPNPTDELGELSTAINSLLARLEASFTAQKQFVSNVSHELRTPLAAVIAQLDLVLQKPRDPERYRTAIEAALSDAKDINSLIDGLLNLAKADYSKQQIKMQPIRLDELLLDVRQRILTAHPEYHIDLIFDIDLGDSPDADDRVITVCGNLYLLSIAFANLIENNCKYSPDHTSLVQISHFDDNAIVRFTDTGAGMTEQEKSQIFRLFYRGEHPGADGHGIGMTLAQKIIALHAGTLIVRSHPGEGTTFLVKIKHL